MRGYTQQSNALRHRDQRNPELEDIERAKDKKASSDRACGRKACHGRDAEHRKVGDA